MLPQETVEEVVEEVIEEQDEVVMEKIEVSEEDLNQVERRYQLAVWRDLGSQV